MTTKRFANLFAYESSNFEGRYRNCKLLEDVYHADKKHVFAMTGEFFSAIIVDMDASEIYFFEEFDDHVPIFTLHFKISYV